jgi:hypothetical protein
VPHGVLHGVQEDGERAEDGADCEVHHRREVGHRDVTRDGRQRARDEGLPAVVVQVGGAGGQQTQGVAEAPGEHPLIERAHGLPGVLQPLRGPPVVLRMAAGAHELPIELLADERMDPEPVLGPQPVHEQALGFAAQQ